MIELGLQLHGALPASVAIVGGNGAIAKLLAQRLAGDGVTVRSIIRRSEQGEGLAVLGAVPVVCDIEAASPADLADAFDSAEAVVFAAGAGAGSGVARKWTVDRDGAVKSAEAAILSGAMRFVQISFIGAEEPTGSDDEVFAAYWNAKRAADESLKLVALDWTIVKPGVLTDDPVTGCGEVTFEPVARGAKTRRADVAELIRLVLADDRTVWKEVCMTEGDTPIDAGLDAAAATAKSV